MTIFSYVEHTPPETTVIHSKPLLADRFEFVSVIGEGAAGNVYRVKDRKLSDREVALKILVNKTAFDENTLIRFRDEIKILQKLRHPNLVEAYDIIEFEDTLAFTMEYVEGADVAKIFLNEEMSYSRIDSLFAQLLTAIQELHLNGVIHRDIKMENVLVRPDGVVKLSDLGLMKTMGAEGLTRTGILLGTAQYMPPEYIRTSKYDARGDIYAAGVMLYEVLCKRRWLADKHGLEALQHLIKSKFEIPLAPLARVPQKYLTVLNRALEPKPKKRYQSAAEMRDAILEIRPKFDGFAGKGVTIQDFCSQEEPAMQRWVRNYGGSLAKWLRALWRSE